MRHGFEYCEQCLLSLHEQSNLSYLPRAGATRWQASIFQLGIVLAATGVLVILLTALKSFGAAELLGQVNSRSVRSTLIGSAASTCLQLHCQNVLHFYYCVVSLQVLGLLLLGSGTLAVAGSSRRSTHFMTASLTVSIVGTLLAFEFIAEVGLPHSTRGNYMLSLQQLACSHLIVSKWV